MKQQISRALREQVWITYVGKKFESKCTVTWCKNTITVFDFQCGHNIPESKGGSTDLLNLFPICSRCNLSMGDNYTLDEWKKLSKPLSKWKVLWYKITPKSWKQLDIKESGTPSLQSHTNQNAKHFKFRGLLSNIKIKHHKKRTATGTNASKKR